MAVQTRRYTVDEFDRMAQLPENAERRLEYIGGEIVSVVSNSYSSEVAANILIAVGAYVKSQKLGRVTGADGGYQIVNERYIPDVAFISQARQPEPSHEAYNSHSPDLAVEVLSPTDDPRLIRLKIAHYLAAGTVVWLVNTEEKHIEVYTPGQPPKMAYETLDGGAVLPVFSMAVKDIFPD
ncbi:MAG: Uma2 family endonuclease [Chloroflexi bacterium]|nr:MAG: Uma2 family endonuclease [Chloroflexota bacterium]